MVERGANYVIMGLGGNRFSWESAPQWVSNGVDWVPYIYSRDEAKKCYNVQVGFVAAKIYDGGVVELYDPELKEVRVKAETWEVWLSGKQATLNAPITWGVVANSSGVFVTRQQTTSKPDGALTIVYSFIVGASLKHTVTWVSTGKAAVTVQVKQVHLMDFDKVTTDSGVSTASKSEKSAAYLFSYGSKGFWLFENQYAMVYDTKSLEPTPTLLTNKCLQTGEIDFAGKKVTYTFGDWTLTSGENLVVDPDSATLNDPTEDGYINATTRYKTSDYLFVGQSAGSVYRGYAQWPTTSIPDTAIITDTVFKYHGAIHNQDCHIHAIAAKPSTASNAVLYADCADGTVYADPVGFPVVGTNKQVDLGATADSDLQGLLASDWFAIGIQSDNEASNAQAYIYAEEYVPATPKPTLYVEYTTGATYSKTASQSITVSSAATRAAELIKSAAKTITFSSAAAKLIEVSKSATKTITFSSASAKLIEVLKTASQSITGAFTTSRATEYSRAITQSISGAFNAARLIEISKSTSQGLGFASSATRIGEWLRAAAQNVSLTSSAAKIFEIVRSAAQTLNIGSSASKLFEIVKSVTQSLTLTNAATKLFDITRTASQILNFGETATRLAEWLKAATQSISLSNAASRLSEAVRAAAQAITLSSASTRIFETVKNVAQTLTLTNVASKLFDITRNVSQSITTSLNANRLIEVIKNVAQSITASLSANRIYEAFRSVAQGITLSNAANILNEFIRSANQAISWLANVVVDYIPYIPPINEYFRSVAQSIITALAAARSTDIGRAASAALSITSTATGWLMQTLNAAASIVINVKSWGYPFSTAPSGGGVPLILLIIIGLMVFIALTLMKRD